MAAEELEAGVDPPTDVGTLEVLAGASLVALVEARAVDPACSQSWSASPRSRGTDQRAEREDRLGDGGELDGSAAELRVTATHDRAAR